MESLIAKLKKVPPPCDDEHLKKAKHKPSRRSAKVVVDRVLAEKMFRCCETTGPCKLGISFPPHSVLSGTVTVTVLECRPVFHEPMRPVQVDILLLLEKKFIVTEPTGRKTPLEFTFYKRCRQNFPPNFTLDCLDPAHVRCIPFEIKKMCVDIRFVPADPDFGGHATIAEQVEVFLLLKLVVKEQLTVSLDHDA